MTPSSLVTKNRISFSSDCGSRGSLASSDGSEGCTRPNGWSVSGRVWDPRDRILPSHTVQGVAPVVGVDKNHRGEPEIVEGPPRPRKGEGRPCDENVARGAWPRPLEVRDRLPSCEGRRQAPSKFRVGERPPSAPPPRPLPSRVLPRTRRSPAWRVPEKTGRGGGLAAKSTRRGRFRPVPSRSNPRPHLGRRLTVIQPRRRT